MAIPRSQLEAWSGKGADTTSAAAYARVRSAIETNWPANVPKPQIYLQGSYANDTNTRGDSDVDVVVEYSNTFSHNAFTLPPEHFAKWQQAFPTTATYEWEHVRRDTLTALRVAFPGAVTEGKKALKVQFDSGRMTVDVVPALSHYEYQSYGAAPGVGHAGIQFKDPFGNPIINYPLIHIANGQAKNASDRTGGQYKSIVRVFKNLRTYLYEIHVLDDGVAPSYFVECLLHNVPDSLFQGSLDQAVLGVLNHLWATPVDAHLTQNGRTLLIGNGNTQWPRANAVAFITAAVNGWNNFA